ncbi:unnamed protein product [Caenorhabditis sp. 36 PRJEB53466]|nr:unnamed protein product [Caenorhabditis sp. 36 PRJEB53466]
MSDSAERLALRGVPKCERIVDVVKWLTKNKLSVEDAEEATREKYNRYRNVEMTMSAQKARMCGKIPEFDNNIGLIDMLIAKRDANEPFVTSFKISEDVYLKAVAKKPEGVTLWVGSDLMVEYGLEEAKQMLQTNRASVQIIADELILDMEYLKDQLTMTEVNLACIINYGVRKRRAIASRN